MAVCHDADRHGDHRHADHAPALGGSLNHPADLLIISGGWVIDPGRWNGVGDVWISQGCIVEVTPPRTALPSHAHYFKADGLIVAPGLVDLHVHLREPGYEEKGKCMPIYEYQAEYCLKSLFCPKRFAFWQNMHDAPVTACRECGAPLEKIPSVFSAGADVMAHSRASSDPPPGSTAPPPTLKNIYGGGLGIQGCGHDCRTHGGHSHGKP